MPRLYRSFYGKIGRRGITQADKLSLQSKMRHTENKRYRVSLRQRVSRGFSRKRKTAFSELGEDDKFNAVFLSNIFITPYVGAHNRPAQATRGWSYSTNHSYLFS